MGNCLSLSNHKISEKGRLGAEIIKLVVYLWSSFMNLSALWNNGVSAFQGLQYMAVNGNAIRTRAKCLFKQDVRISGVPLYPLHFQCFLFISNISIVHHFDMVNNLDTVETGHMQTPNMC